MFALLSHNGLTKAKINNFEKFYFTPQFSTLGLLHAKIEKKKRCFLPILSRQTAQLPQIAPFWDDFDLLCVSTFLRRRFAMHTVKSSRS